MQALPRKEIEVLLKAFRIAQLRGGSDDAIPIQRSSRFSRPEWLGAQHKELHLIKPGSPLEV